MDNATIHRVVVHFMQGKKLLHVVVGLTADEHIPVLEDLVTFPDIPAMYRVTGRRFSYGSNGQFGNLRQVAVLVEEV